MHPLIHDGKVIQLASEIFEVNSALTWGPPQDGVQIGDSYDGGAYTHPTAPPVAVSRSVSGVVFLELWTPDEVAAATAADPRLLFGSLKATAQNAVNLDSPELASLLALAVSKGALTADRAAQITAGTPPAP